MDCINPIPKQFFIIFLVVYICFKGYSQPDTINVEMKFDLGITRGWNIDALPLLRVVKTDEKRDIQICWPVFKFEKNYKTNRKYSRFLPFYITDSLTDIIDYRIGTLYYPSFFRYSVIGQQKIRSVRLIELAPEINFLQISRSDDGLFVQNNAFFLLWHRNDVLNSRSYLIFFPIYWQFQSQQLSSVTLFPFYSSVSNQKKDKRFTAITPFFYRFLYKNGKKSILFPLYYSRNDSIKNNHIIIPFYWHFKNQKYTSFTFIPLFSTGHSPDFSKKHFAVTPLLWNLIDRDEKRFTVFPLYWMQQSGKGKTYVRSDILFPVYWHFHSDYETSHTILPVFFYNKTNRLTSLSVIPVYSKSISADSLSGHQMITPFYWKIFNPKYSFETIFPFYWSYNDELATNRLFFPVVWSLQNERRKICTVFPLFSVKRSFYDESSSFSITLIFTHYHDKLKRSNILFPVLWDITRFRQDDTTRTDVIFPLLWYYNSRQRGHIVLFPLFWKINSSDYRSFSLLPLFSAGESIDSLRKHLVITPLFWYFKNSYGASYSLFPLWWNKSYISDAKTRYFNVVFPVYWTFRDGERKAKIVFPVWWYFYNDLSQSFTLFPFYFNGINHKKQSHYKAYTPLFWNFSNSNLLLKTFFPLYWNTSRYYEDDTVKRQIILPIFWSARSNEKSSTVVFPLLWDISNVYYRSFTFIPLFSTGSSVDNSRRHRVISPLIWYFGGDNWYNLTVLPIFHAYKEGQDNKMIKRQVLFPVYWRYKADDISNITILPFFWSRNNSKLKVLAIVPLFLSVKSLSGSYSLKMITHFYWKTIDNDERLNLLLPFYYRFASNEINRLVAFPVLYKYQTPEKSRSLLFPLFFKFKNQKYKSTTLFPLFSAGESTDSSRYYKVITPLYWHFCKNGYSRSTLIPFYGSSYDKYGNYSLGIFYFLMRYREYNHRKTFHFVWPVIEYSADSSYSYFRITPIIWYKKSDKSSYMAVLPFYYRRCDSVTYSSNILGILFRYQEVVNVKKSYGFLWKLVYYDKYFNGDYEFRILYFLFTHLNQNGETEKSFFPFYRITSNSKGEKSKSMGLFFYNSFRKKIPDTNEFYQEQKLFWFIRIRSNIKSLEQKGIIKPGEKIKL